MTETIMECLAAAGVEGLAPADIADFGQLAIVTLPGGELLRIEGEIDLGEGTGQLGARWLAEARTTPAALIDDMRARLSWDSRANLVLAWLGALED